MNRIKGLLVGLFAAAVILPACGLTQEASGPNSKEQPSQLVPIAGTNTSRVVLTAVAAAHLGIETVVVRLAPVSSAAGAIASITNTVIPVEALIYDKDGGIWVYAAVLGAPTNATGLPLTYVRESVSVERIDGDAAVLNSGPAPGTQVVTVGADELLGSEYGVEGQ